MWAIVDRIRNPFEILRLSLVSKRFAETTRNESTWRRHLAVGGWDIDAILRHSNARSGEGASNALWRHLARASCDRWHVMHPEWPSRVIQPDYIEKLARVTSEIDSNNSFFDETRDIARFLASHEPDDEEDERQSYWRLLVIARYLYHDVSLGKASQEDYQRWSRVYSYQVISRGELSVNSCAAETLKALCIAHDFQAYRYINQALEIFIEALQDIVQCAEGVMPSEANYRRILPKLTIPDTTWLTNSTGLIPWMGPEGGPGPSWWSLRERPITLEGYYSYGSFLEYRGVFEEDNSTRMKIRAGDHPYQFVGTGRDNAGDFSIEGRVDGVFATFNKHSEGRTWQYSGIILPWALVGIWQSPGDGGNPEGTFCLWPTG